MADEKSAAEKSRDAFRLSNEIREGTGEFDARFLLWRTFCADNDVPVDTLPSDLIGEVKDRWDKLKSEKLKAEKP